MSDIEQSLQKALRNLAERSAEKATSTIPGTNIGPDVERAMMGSNQEDDRRDHIKEQASQTVVSLTEAKLAKKLGYELCLCTFPPSVMLWRETEKANVCPSCGRQSKTK